MSLIALEPGRVPIELDLARVPAQVRYVDWKSGWQVKEAPTTALRQLSARPVFSIAQAFQLGRGRRAGSL